MMMTFGVIFLLATVIALLLTNLLRRYALARSLLDIPNERSSHTIPTPRGGGLAIVLAFLGCLPLLWVWEGLATSVFVGIAGSGLVVALVGFWDDHSHIPARWRLLAHFVGAGWVLICLGGLPSLPVLGLLVDLGWFGYLLTLVYLVWLLNLFNFMDGIDGIAGIEAITACLGGAVVYVLVVPAGIGWTLPILLLAATAGFLFWNFPKARIFMGDSGSGFVGLLLGVFSIDASIAAPKLFWCWVILLGVFVVDATVTLLRRISRGEKIYKAHRSHAYQYAARKYCAHWPVSITVCLINLFWLLPFAVMVSLGRLDGVVGVLFSYIPLVWLAFYYKSGARELQVF